MVWPRKYLNGLTVHHYQCSPLRKARVAEDESDLQRENAQLKANCARLRKSIDVLLKEIHNKSCDALNLEVTQCMGVSRIFSGICALPVSYFPFHFVRDRFLYCAHTCRDNALLQCNCTDVFCHWFTDFA